MKLLIIDDDFNIVNNLLKNLNYEKLGIEEREGAVSAEEAKTLMNRAPADIVLCDIEMPGENGISLIRWIRYHYPDTVCIFLTAHADFAYAQQGVHLGCFDYILQPAVTEHIEEVLLKAVQKVQTTRWTMELTEWGQYLNDNKEEIAESFSYKLLFGGETDFSVSLKALTDFAYRFLYSEKNYLIAIRLFSDGREKATEERSMLAFLLRNILAEAAGVAEEEVLCTFGRLADTFFLICPAVFSEPKLFQTHLETYREAVENSVNGRAAVFYCSTETFDYSQLRKSVSDIEKAISDNVRKQNKVFQVKLNHSELGELDRFELQKNSIQLNMERWKKYLISEKYEFVKNEIHTYLYSVLDFDVHLNLLIEFNSNIVQVILVALNEKKINVSDFFEKSPYSYAEFIDAYHTIDSLDRVVMSVIDSLKACAEQDKNMRPVVDRIVQYICNHVEEDFSVVDIAEHLHFSQEYLSKKFKKEMNMTIKEYIIQEKMKVAEDMLINTQMPVSLIASNIGYTNLSYFSVAFKKYYGCAPSDYRRGKNNSSI